MTAAEQTASERNTAFLYPYVFFYGRCEEALEFYKDVFGGTYEAMRVDEGPMAEHVAPDFKNKIMHAHFSAPGIAFYCSDGREAKDVDPEAGNIALALNIPERAKAATVVQRLAEGGDVRMPLKEAFWGGQFANVVDKFGNEWMITSA
jgi:PhnB protein